MTGPVCSGVGDVRRPQTGCPATSRLRASTRCRARSRRARRSRPGGHISPSVCRSGVQVGRRDRTRPRSSPTARAARRPGSPHNTAVFSNAIRPASTSGTARGEGASAAVQWRAARPGCRGIPRRSPAGRRTSASAPTSSAAPSPRPGSATGPARSSGRRSRRRSGRPCSSPTSRSTPTTPGCCGSAATRRSGRSMSMRDPGERRDTIRFPGATRSGLATRSNGVGPREEYVAILSSLMVPVVPVVRRADGDHLPRVAGAGDGDVSVAPAVAGGAHHHDPGVPERVHGFDQRVVRRRLEHRVPEGDVHHADAVLGLVVEDPLEPGEDVRGQPASEAVEDAHRDQARLGGDPGHASAGMAAVADHDSRDVGAVAVGVDALLGRSGVRHWPGRRRRPPPSWSGCPGAGPRRSRRPRS